MSGCFMRTLPFSTLHDAMLTMLVYATRWLSMPLYTLAYMFMHKSCLLVCHPYFNTIKSLTFDPNLHLFPREHHLIRLLILLLVMSPATCQACFACMLVCFITIAHYLHISFFPLLVCWFLVFAFACTHMKGGRMELGHGLPGASKKGEDASIWI